MKQWATATASIARVDVTSMPYARNRREICGARSCRMNISRMKAWRRRYRAAAMKARAVSSFNKRLFEARQPVSWRHYSRNGLGAPKYIKAAGNGSGMLSMTVNRMAYIDEGGDKYRRYSNGVVRRGRTVKADESGPTKVIKSRDAEAARTSTNPKSCWLLLIINGARALKSNHHVAACTIEIVGQLFFT